MPTKTAEKNLTTFIKSLDPKLSAIEMTEKAQAAGFKPVRETSRPLGEWLSARVHSIRYALGITNGNGRHKPKAATNPKAKAAKRAAPAPASAPATVERVPQVKTIARASVSGEAAFAHAVKRIGTDRARELLEKIEAEP